MRRSLRLVSAGTCAGIAAAAGALLLVHGGTATAAVVDPAHVVVFRVGSGAALTNAAAPVFLDRYTTAGTLEGTVTVPAAASGTNHALTASGLSRSEGRLSLSPDGTLLSFAGYDAPVGTSGPAGSYTDVNGATVSYTPSLTASDPATVGRVVGLLDGSGAVDTSTSVKGAGVPHVVRAATTVDGSSLYLGGSDGGVLNAARGASTASEVLAATGLDTTALAVGGGQLFATGGYDAQPAKRVVTVGAGTPTSGAGVTGLGGLPSNLLPGGFAALDLTANGLGNTGLDTLYVANASEKAGAIDKFVFDGTTWGKVGSLPLDGVLAVTAKATGTVVQLAATTKSALWTFTETDGTASGFATTTPTSVATAPTGTEFRGVAVAPTGAALSKLSLAITSPSAGQHLGYLTGSFTVRGTASATQGVSGVTVKVDNGETYPATLAGGTWSRTISASGLPVGTHTLTVAARDTTGAVTTATRTFVRDGVPAGTAGPGAYSYTSRLVTKSAGWTTVGYGLSPDKRALRTTGTASVRLTSYGRGLDLHFQRRTDAGRVRVTVDGKAYVIDLRSTANGDLVKAFRGLSAGKHAITIQALHQRSTASKGYVVLLGSLRVYA